MDDADFSIVTNLMKPVSKAPIKNQAVRKGTSRCQFNRLDILADFGVLARSASPPPPMSNDHPVYYGSDVANVNLPVFTKEVPHTYDKIIDVIKSMRQNPARRMNEQIHQAFPVDPRFASSKEIYLVYKSAPTVRFPFVECVSLVVVNVWPWSDYQQCQTAPDSDKIASEFFTQIFGSIPTVSLPRYHAKLSQTVAHGPAPVPADVTSKPMSDYIFFNGNTSKITIKAPGQLESKHVYMPKKEHSGNPHPRGNRFSNNNNNGEERRNKRNNNNRRN